jgi:hypothetical protein
MKFLPIFVIATVLIVGQGLSASATIDSMRLQGQGEIRYLGFIKVYDAYLFIEDPEAAADVLNPSVSKCLQLSYHVSLTPENFIEGANTILARQHGTDHLEELRDDIELLHGTYQPVKKGDSYQLCYQAETVTTTLSLNGRELVSVKSANFSSAYFGIWLGDNQPLDSDLRRNLVNQEN